MIQDATAAAIRELIETLNTRHGENINRLDVTDKKVDEAIRRIDALHEAFPDADTVGHRMYHESLIKRIEARSKLYEDLRSDLAKKGLWALILTLGAAIWFYFKSKVMG